MSAYKLPQSLMSELDLVSALSHGALAQSLSRAQDSLLAPSTHSNGNRHSLRPPLRVVAEGMDNLPRLLSMAQLLLSDESAHLLPSPRMDEKALVRFLQKTIADGGLLLSCSVERYLLAVMLVRPRASEHESLAIAFNWEQLDPAKRVQSSETIRLLFEERLVHFRRRARFEADAERFSTPAGELSDRIERSRWEPGEEELDDDLDLDWDQAARS